MRTQAGLLRRQAGFTLIELLTVIAVIALLLVGGVFLVGNKVAQARDAERRTELKEIQTGLEQYFTDHAGYPVELVFNNQPLTSADGQTTYLPRVHPDPVNRDPYLYVYNATPAGTPTSYDLCAYKLESVDDDPSADESWCLHNLQQ